MKTQLNVPLIRKIQAHILAEPRRLDMSDWWMRYGKEDMEYPDAPPCGTAGCIAGWAVLLEHPYSHLSGDQIPKSAARLLGLPFNKELAWSQQDELRAIFLVGDWPLDLQDRWYEASNLSDMEHLRIRAEVTAERLDRVVKQYANNEEETKQ